MKKFDDYLKDRAYETVANPDVVIPSFVGSLREPRFRLDEETGRLLEGRGYTKISDGRERPVTIKYNRRGGWSVKMGVPK